MSLNDAISGLCLYWFRYFISAYHQLENVLITWWWSSREVSFLLVQNCGGEIYSFVVLSSDCGSLVYFCCAGCLEPSFIVLRYVSVFHLACAESWNIALLCDKCKNYLWDNCGNILNDSSFLALMCSGCGVTANNHGYMEFLKLVVFWLSYSSLAFTCLYCQLSTLFLFAVNWLPHVCSVSDTTSMPIFSWWGLSTIV